ncbi:MAG: hypothetical protein H6577_05140 [Lewinellaceae bacterium]|nr:hypothetical protein [Saprospiraceae bacterium]MCB9337490.1 hypothetical protein [Lewinellaceae bacterium]
MANTGTDKPMNVAIGELQLHHDLSGHLVAKVECQLTAPSLCSVLLLDRLGRVRLEERRAFGAGISWLKLHLPKLEAGHYHAWIDLGGKTFVRPLHI